MSPLPTSWNTKVACWGGKAHITGLTTELGCFSTGPQASSGKHNPPGSAKKDSASTQLSDMPMESQIEELTARCFLPSLLERVEMPTWRLHRQRDHVPLPCSEDLYLPRRAVVPGLAWGRGIPQCPMTPGSQENLYRYWAVPSLSLEELKGPGCVPVRRGLAWPAQNPGFSPQPCVHRTWLSTPVIPAL